MIVYILIVTGMNDLQVQGKGQPGEVVLSITYPAIPNLKYNFKMTIEVQEQVINGFPKTLITTTLHLPQKNITLKPLPPNKIYKITCKCSANQQQLSKTVFVFVPLPPSDSQIQENQSESVQISQIQSESIAKNSLIEAKPRQKRPVSANMSNSEHIMKLAGRSVGITNPKKLQRYVLQGRKCRNVGQFLNTRGQKQYGDRMRLIQKQEMLLKGRMVLGEVYKERQGMKFLKNDWFMGPFYSYDYNQEQINRHRN